MGDSKQSMSLDDLPFIIADVMESAEFQFVKMIDCVVSSSLNGEASQSNADVVLSVDGEECRGKGVGNGGFDAFIKAANEIMARKQDYQIPKLVDYEVRIPKGGRTDALTECIITCLLYTSPSPRDATLSRMPSSA